MIAILVAVRQELRPILRRAQAGHVVRQTHLDFYEGTLGGQPVALLALGIGKECARIAAEITIRCYRPDLIISAGFGGGLASEVEDGDIVIGTEVLELAAEDDRDIRWRCAHKSAALPVIEPTKSNHRVHFGRIITVPEMILESATKKRLGRATGALAVDMETSAVADVATARKTNFLAVRCITDNDHEDLPEEFNDFFVLGQLQPGRILSACSRRPYLLADLSRLGRRARASGQNLARFLEAALLQLPQPAPLDRDLP
jgi:adenosylhomocysteine nucleosidase